jgi:hypothetical protein
MIVDSFAILSNQSVFLCEGKIQLEKIQEIYEILRFFVEIGSMVGSLNVGRIFGVCLSICVRLMIVSCSSCKTVCLSKLALKLFF